MLNLEQGLFITFTITKPNLPSHDLKNPGALPDNRIINEFFFSKRNE
jgi:hypothetical protein